MNELLELVRVPLKYALLPPGLLIVLLLLGLLMYRRPLGRLMAWLGLLGLYLSSVGATSLWLGRQLETYPAQSAKQLVAQGSEAILLLAAGYRKDNPELAGLSRPDDLSLQRLSYSIKLHRETGLPIIISGGPSQQGEQALAVILAHWLRERAGIEPLALETESTTTWENLEYSKQLLSGQGISRVALVTHAFHMPRAMRAAAIHGLSASPAPFGYFSRAHTSTPDYRHGYLWAPTAKDFRHNYLLLHELLGNYWYRLKA